MSTQSERPRLVVDEIDPHERGAARARRSQRIVVQPLPPGRQVWVAWDEEMECPHPWDALFIAFELDSLQLDSVGIRRQRMSHEKYTHHSIAWPDWNTGRELEACMDYGNVWVFVPADWESGWVELGKNAFWTEAAARKEIFARKAKRDAAG